VLAISIWIGHPLHAHTERGGHAHTPSLALECKAAAPSDGSGRCTANGVQLAEEDMAWFREKAASLKPLGFDYTEQTEGPWSQLLNV
jgi:hypothetical protein